MVGDRASRYAKDVETLFVAGALGDLGDAQLLERFLEHDRDGQAAEMAFAALMERHAADGLAGLRRRTGRRPRRAGRVSGDVLGPGPEGWLGSPARIGGELATWGGVRLAARVKRGAARRRSHERRGGEMMTARRGMQGGPPAEESWPELHEELSRLPERFREPILLCLVEGLTQEQAARRLGWPIGTVQSRLARGRERLRDRLVRRGLTFSAAAFTDGVGTSADAAVTVAWVESTARAAVQIAAGRSIAGSVPAAVLLLWQTGLRSLLMNRLLIAGGVAAAIGVIAAGSAAVGRVGQGRGVAAARTGEPPRTQTDRSAAPADEVRGADKAPSIEGRWVVLYIAGNVNGKREAFVEPNMIVPITERMINLPILNKQTAAISGVASKDGRTGAGVFSVSLNNQAPIVYRGTLDYTAERKDHLDIIHVLSQNVGGKRPVWMQGIYRLAGDNLVICYNSEIGTMPATFAADKETEILLILRHETPLPRGISRFPPAESRFRRPVSQGSGVVIDPPGLASRQTV